jgi:hypothetical protein
MATPPMAPISPEQLINFLYAIYYFLRDALAFLLEVTLFREHPQYAATYGDAITFLISLTAFYLILEFISSAKKWVKIILILGWGLLILSIAISASII